MALYPDYRYLTLLLELRGDGRQPHGELGLVYVGFEERAGEVGLEFWDGVAEAGPVLGGDVDGDGEGVGGAEDLGRGEEDFVEVVDCWAEFLLEVADAAGAC